MSTNSFTHSLSVRRLIVVPLILALLTFTLFGVPGLALADSSYTVKSGDSLTKIARVNNTTVEALVNANKAKYPCLATNAACLQIGWVITIPGGNGTANPTGNTPSTYTVQSGDSLAKIAKKLGVDFNALIAANKKDRPCLAAATPCALQVGWVLNVPGGVTAPVAVDDVATVISKHIAATNARDYAGWMAGLDPNMKGYGTPEFEQVVRKNFTIMEESQITYELIGTPIVTIEGDSATALCTVFVTSRVDNSTVIVIGTYYLHKIQGQWKIYNADPTLP